MVKWRQFVHRPTVIRARQKTDDTGEFCNCGDHRMPVRKGDWVVLGIDGSSYVLDPATFERLYRPREPGRNTEDDNAEGQAQEVETVRSQGSSQGGGKHPRGGVHVSDEKAPGQAQETQKPAKTRRLGRRPR